MIETPRLSLRPWKSSDTESFVELNLDKDVMEFFPETYTREQSEAFIERMMEKISGGRPAFLAAELKETGEFLGFIGLNEPSFESQFTPCTEIGWRLHKRFWRQGFATEGAASCLEYAWDHLQLSEVVAFTPTLNLPSIGVMKKLGMRTDPKENFKHPAIPDGHPLQELVLYRISRS